RPRPRRLRGRRAAGRPSRCRPRRRAPRVANVSAPRVEVPAAMADPADRDETWAPWVRALPRLVGDLLEEWRLTLDGAPSHGRCAIVVPVRTEDATPAALKVGWPHDEARHEHLALQHWHGRGAVTLLRA